MSDWAVFFLAVIAVATLATAIAQIGVLIAVARLARRVERFVGRSEGELGPLFGYLNQIGRDASKATALAAAQVERADRLFADVASRLEQTVNTLQTAIGGTAREGAAVVAGLRAALSVIRGARAGRAGRHAEEEDGLFI